MAEFWSCRCCNGCNDAHTHSSPEVISESETLSCVSALPCRDDFDMCFYGISWNRILHGYHDRGPPHVSDPLSGPLLLHNPHMFYFSLHFPASGKPTEHGECCLQSARSLANLIRFVHFIKCIGKMRKWEILIFTNFSVYSFSCDTLSPNTYNSFKSNWKLTRVTNF